MSVRVGAVGWLSVDVGWQVVPHRTGRWLVIVGERQFGVSAQLGLKLQAFIEAKAVPASLPAVIAYLNHAAQMPRSTRSSRRALWLQLTLIPGHLVRYLAEPLSVLTRGRGLSALVLLGLVGYSVGYMVCPSTGFSVASVSSPSMILPALAMFVMTAVWHELGHAAALIRQGYPPGRIGVGVLFLLPVLFADVTALKLLFGRDRLKVDLSGVCFQIAAGGLYWTIGGLLGPYGAGVRLAGGLALVAVCWSLLPVVRSDGYWVICDLLGLADLDHSIKGTSRRPELWVVVLLVCLRFINSGFLLLICLVVPRRLAGLLADVVNGCQMYVLSEQFLTISLYALFAALIARRILRLMMASWLDFVAWYNCWRKI